LQGQLPSARQEYERASRLRCNGVESVAGTLALGALHFRQGAYAEALRQYRSALQRLPSAPPEARLGIAACHVMLGDVAKAEVAYARVLELDPGCTQALLGLAALALAGAGDAAAVRRGSQLLAQAFALDPGSPHALVLLSHVSLRQGFADRAARLAQAALDRADADEAGLRGDALAALARAHHAAGRPKDALAAYQRAMAADPSAPLVRLGVAQMSVLSGEHAAAAATLEALLEERPAWNDALRVLGPLLPRLPTARAGTRAARHFREAAERDSGGGALWEMLGDALAASDPAGALAAYRRAIDEHRRAAAAAAAVGGGAPAAVLPARLLNNASVLQLRAGDARGALALAAEALASAAGGGLCELGAGAQVTLGYNAARVREATGDLRDAEAEYAALLEQFPLYVDCHLRLGAIALGRGDLAAADRWAEGAAGASGRAPDSLALMASVALARRDQPGAKALLEELSAAAGGGQRESYARLAAANLHLAAVPGDQRRDEARRKAEAQLAHALGLYRRVLEKDEGNLYAANGVGCVLAESGHLAAAREVFLRVHEAVAGADGFAAMPHAGANLASACLGLGQHEAAAQAYASALQRHHRNHEPRLMLYLAKAQHGARRPADALRTLCRAAHLAPADPRLRFNMAYVMQEAALAAIEKERPPGDATKAGEFSEAVRQLATAHGLFVGLREMGPDASGVPTKKLEEHINFVAKTHEVVVERAEIARREAAAAAARRQEQRLQLEAAARMRDVEARRAAAQEEAEARAREGVAREAAGRLERLKEEWKAGAVLSRAAEAGDAGMVAKAGEARGKEAAGGGMADAMLDALFAVDDEDDFEYVPGQEDSAGGGGPLEGAAALAAAGLASSDDDGEDFDPGAASDGGEEGAEAEAAPAAAAAAKPAAAKKKGAAQKRGRLQKKRPRGGGEAGGLEDDQPAAGGAGATPKRPRAAAALEDSDSDDEPLLGAPKITALGSDSE
jgi:RNA polymerase-associated protein CTR9